MAGAVTGSTTFSGGCGAFRPVKYGVEEWNCAQSALSAGDDGVVEGEDGSTAGDDDIVGLGSNCNGYHVAGVTTNAIAST